MNYNAIIFDFDGVILDSEPLHFQASLSVLAPLAITFDYDHYLKNYVGVSDKEMFSKILMSYNKNINLIESQRLLQDKIKAYVDILEKSENLPFVEGCEDYIQFLKAKNKKLAICTGSTRAEVNVALKKAKTKNLENYFNTIVTFEDVKKGKPDPEGYLLAAERLGVFPEKCLVFEDSPAGINAAKAAGMTVFALSTTCTKKQLSQADQVYSNFIGVCL